ncbi:MAG: hypothetical protein J3K34DRAFT_517614 [Monoraphidium minutum]|nr:MAG: hypothetical protein J3K34DRAFT_517614 [Monoraphidium minutum]
MPPAAAAAAAAAAPLPEQAWEQLLAALAAKAQQAAPQEAANALWAAAKRKADFAAAAGKGGVTGVEAALLQLAAAVSRQQQQPLPEQAWEQLLAALAAKAQQAAPQEAANALWAAAKRKADFAAAAGKGGVTGVEAALLQLAAAVSRQQVASMKPQEVSNNLWALSELRLRLPGPTALLAEAALQQAPAMKPQELSNTALALARLGLHDARLFAALMGAAAQQGQRFSAEPQHTANLAWAVAVADQQQLSRAAAALCEQLARSSAWGSTVAEDRGQLWQVHLWLQEGQQAGSGGGLAGALSAAQLQQCAAAWEESLQQTARQRRTDFERQVLACAQRLSCLTDCRREARTPDGAFSVDVAATHAASGRRLAIEADGPTHFLRPGGQPTGETLARNRALAARGYVVVPLSYWEWGPLRGDAAAQDAYLQRTVEAALQQAQRESGTDGGAAAAAARLRAAGLVTL